MNEIDVSPSSKSPDRTENRNNENPQNNIPQDEDNLINNNSVNLSPDTVHQLKETSISNLRKSDYRRLS
jgi:hypothetical protein